MKKLPLIVLIVALGGFVFGLANLLRLRFEAGDNYPPYSSYRADPIGTKALYESVDSLTAVRRNLQPLAKLGDGRDTTLLWLGESPSDLRLLPEEFKDLETFVRSGGRLVMAAAPIFVRPRTNIFALIAASRAGPGGAPTNRLPRLPDEFRTIDVQAHWDVTFDFAPLAKNDQDRYEPAPAELRGSDAPPDLPRFIDVHSGLCFTALDPAWRTIYARAQRTNVQPVLIERPMGRGSIVLFADSWHFSNEALRDDRQPALLSWLIGSGREVVFEETHLGTSEDPGVATLARKYRLQPLFAALLLLAALFIWKNAASFMPPCAEQLARERGEIVEGRDSAGAFVNLLRRSIAPANLLRVCLEQWNAAALRKPPRAKLEEMQRIIDAQNALEPKNRNPLVTYREFCRVLSKKL